MRETTKLPGVKEPEYVQLPGQVAAEL